LGIEKILYRPTVCPREKEHKIKRGEGRRHCQSGWGKSDTQHPYSAVPEHPGRIALGETIKASRREQKPHKSSNA